MANLRNRIERLEKSISPISQEAAQHYRYTWGDWTNEELELACKCLRVGETLPPELKEKIRDTAPSGRLVDLSEGEKAEILQQLRALDDYESGDEDD